jgi:hypothetical protein
MKKYGTGIALTFALALFLESMGWWQAMIVAGIASSFWVASSLAAFSVGFLGVAAAWCTLLVLAEVTHHIFSIMKLTGQIFGLPANLSFLLLLITLLLGGFMGGLGGLIGFWWRKTIQKNNG